MELIEDQLFGLAADALRGVIWLVFLLVLFVPIERIFAIRRQRVLRQGFFADLVYYFLSSLTPKLFLVIPLTILALVTHKLIPFDFYVQVAALPTWVRLLGALVVGDTGSYWGHRLMHQIPFLWRFHEIHHSAEEMDWLVNTRAHPVDLVFTRLCGFLPLYLLGLAQPVTDRVDPVPIIVALTGTFWGFFIHANLRWRFGWLEWLVSSPAFHHWHHTNDGPGLRDKNFAAMLPMVDKCFGTFYLPKALPVKYGLDTPMASGVVGQLVRPILPNIVSFDGDEELEEESDAVLP